MAEKKKTPITPVGQAEDKKKALETALAQIEKNYGKGAIMRLGDDIPINVDGYFYCSSTQRQGTHR